MLNNSEAIQETLTSVNGLLNEEQYGALNVLKETRNLLGKAEYCFFRFRKFIRTIK